MSGSFDIFSPQIGLHPYDMGSLFRSFQVVRNRVERIDLFNRNISADSERLVLYIVGLVEIEIKIRCRNHYHIMSHVCGKTSALGPRPRHHGSIRGKPAFKYLVPSYDAAAFGVDEFLHTLDGITLQSFLGSMLRIVFQTEFGYLRLTYRTSFPTHLRALVTADMDVLGRENVHYLGIYVLKKIEGLFLAHAQHVISNPPTCPDLVRTSGTAQFGVGGKGSQHVPRHVYFGNHRNIALGGVSYYLPCLILCIIASVRDAVRSPPLLPYDGTAAVCPLFRQLRPALDFDAPALVIRDVPVQDVYIVQGEYIYVSLYELYREHVPCHVQMGTPVLETRHVLNRPTGYFHTEMAECFRSVRDTFVIARYRDNLPQCLHPVKDSCRRMPAHCYPVRGYFQRI